jgi:hypothetical protein
MKLVFTREGFRHLQGTWLMLAAACAAAIGLAVGGRWYLDHERRERLSGTQRLEQARARLENARRERDNLRESADIYRMLLENGLLQPERRLDMVELVNGLRSRHNLFTLEYDIGAQRPLPLAAGQGFAAVEVLASRVKLRLKALHEGDVLGFVDALHASRHGFFPLERCVMKRLDVADAKILQPRVEAECTFEWITLKDKNAGRPG